MPHYFYVAKMSTYGNNQNSDIFVNVFIIETDNKIIYIVVNWDDIFDISHKWQQNIVKNSEAIFS